MAVENNLNKKDIKIVFLVILISGIILATPFILSYDIGLFSLNDENLARIGTALSITSPFIGIISGVLVYLAFRQQYKANNKIQEQFDRQSSDSLFFKIIESFNSKIINSKVYDSQGKAHEGIQTLEYILDDFKNRLVANTYEIGKNIVEKNITVIDSDVYRRISLANGYSFTEPKQLVNHLNLGRKETDIDFRKIVKKIGEKYIYDSEYTIRREAYFNAFKNLRNSHPGVTENYLATLKYLLEFLNQHSNIPMYKSYFIGNMTNIERAILFYYCASYSNSTTLTTLIINSGILDEIEPYIEHLYGNIDLAEAIIEYEYIKSR